MQYIILDLEWNQPISWQSPVYRQIGDRLIFEMIQIGAVKLDENLQIADSLSLPIAPTHYIQIHPRIRRMTGLGTEELAGAPAFREALEEFAAWCGEDYVLLTWGCDDVSVLQQNIDFFECGDIHLAPLCDIQKLFEKVHGLKDRPSLNAAVLEYAQTPRSLIHKPRKTREKTPAAAFPSMVDALDSDAALKPTCPRCGRILSLDGEYVLQSPDRYITIGKCGSHGKMLLRLAFRTEEEGQVLMRRSPILNPTSQMWLDRR